MAREKSSRLEQVRAWIERVRAEGYPDELAEMFQGVVARFDNANRLTALFGVVDKASEDEAWALYEQYQASCKRPTYH